MNRSESRNGKSRTLLASLFLPAALGLVAMGVLPQRAKLVLQIALVGLAAFSLGIGWRAGYGGSPTQRWRPGMALATTGLVFAVNGFVLLLGCASPPAGGSVLAISNYRPDATSRKELARIARQIPARDAKLTTDALDLAPFYNTTMAEDWQTKIGPANLAALPAGAHEFAGVTFDVRGAIRLCSQPNQDGGRKFPISANRIRVDRVAHRLHFLHGFGWETTALTPVATYVVRYADGQRAEVPVVFGRDVLASWSAAGREEIEAQFLATGGIVAWKQTVEMARPKSVRTRIACRLFVTTWQNPRPLVKIESLDLIANRKVFATPFLVALTADSKG